MIVGAVEGYLAMVQDKDTIDVAVLAGSDVCVEAGEDGGVEASCVLRSERLDGKDNCS